MGTSIAAASGKTDLKKKTPRPGFEPGSKAPEASRMSTTLPRHLKNECSWCLFLIFSGQMVIFDWMNQQNTKIFYIKRTLFADKLLLTPLGKRDINADDAVL
jgi:hypothetical protein